jgi:hypothetical protein
MNQFVPTATPPLRRPCTRSAVGVAPARTSFRPSVTVLIAIPVARATAISAPSYRLGLGAGRQPTESLVHRPAQLAPLQANGCFIHIKRRSHPRDRVDPRGSRSDRLIHTRALTVHRHFLQAIAILRNGTGAAIATRTARPAGLQGLRRTTPECGRDRRLEHPW